MSQALIKETQSGRLRGAWASKQEGIQVFRGVPFAQPPLGDLRWRPPLPVEPWEDVQKRRATAPPAASL